MSKKHKKQAKSLSPPRPKKTNWLVFGVVAIMIVALIALLTKNSDKGEAPDRIPTNQTPTVTTYEFHKEGELRFLNAHQELITSIDIEIARDESEREVGLMYREKMAENQGMLFVFDDADVRSFWMKNTLISLDMIFVDGKNQIITIHKHTIPLSEGSYASTGPAKYVIEVNAGFTDAHHIKEGDRISWTTL